MKIRGSVFIAAGCGGVATGWVAGPWTVETTG